MAVLQSIVRIVIIVHGSLIIAFAQSFPNAQCFAIDVQKSSVVVRGSSNINHFSCTADTFSGIGKLLPSRTIRGYFLLPVRSFDCGKKQMNGDLRQTLRGDLYPEIVFVLENIERIRSVSVDSAIVDVCGNLTIAGQTRKIEFPVSLSMQDRSEVKADGRFTVNLLDFGIEPPKVLFGLIRVNERIEIDFHLVIYPIENNTCAEITVQENWKGLCFTNRKVVLCADSH